MSTNPSEVSVVNFLADEDVRMLPFKNYEANSYDHRPVKVLLLGTITLTIDAAQKIAKVGGIGTSKTFLDYIMLNQAFIVERVLNGTATFGAILFENGDQGICFYRPNYVSTDNPPILKALYVDDNYLRVWDEFATLINNSRHELMHNLLNRIAKNQATLTKLRHTLYHKCDVISDLDKIERADTLKSIQGCETEHTSLTHKAKQYMRIKS